MKISSAYSLIELSVVILIIGVLIGGATEGNKLIKKSKLKTARALTKGSDASVIDDMILWLDATAEGSMVNASSSTIVQDGNTVQTWNDVNPQVITKYSFTQGTDARRPLYEDNGINGLPTLYFDADGSNANGKALHQPVSSPFEFPSNQISVFIVARPSIVTTSTYVIDSYNSTTSSRLYVIYSNIYRTTFTSGGSIADNSNIILNKNYIISVTANNSAGSLYRNGIFQNSGATVHVTFAATAGNGFTIGSFYNSAIMANFDGYISEIIMYSRALETRERKAIERYLGQKYGIQVS